MAFYQNYYIRKILIFISVLSLAAATASSIHSSRVRKQTGNTRYDVRNCDAIPPYIPETAFPSANLLLKLREEMRKKDIDAYIIPAEDAHQSEYIAERDQRRRFISGFSGYADHTISPWSGVAIVTRNKDFKSREKAAVWVDSRYFVQAQMEMDCNWLSMEIGEENVLNPDDWLTGDTLLDTDERHAQLPDGARVGFDPTLLSITTYFEYNETFIESPRDIVLVPVIRNLVDIVWEETVGGEENLPEYPGEELIVLEKAYSGRTWQSKIFYDDPLEDFETNVRSEMEKWGAQVVVIHKLDEIAWLFNLRGADIPYNPMFIAYCIITNSDIRLYMYDGTRRTDEVRYRDVHLHLGLSECTSGPTCISLRNYENFLNDLEDLGRSSRVIWHSDQASFAIYERVRDIKRIERPSPVLLMKAQKNDVEILGMKSAYLKDSVALCNLFGYLQEKMDNMDVSIRDRGNINYLSELSVVDEAEQTRESLWGEVYHGKSFATISAFADHGGLIHYEVTEETNVPIHYNGMYLFNSGAQYKEGTTDLTRTFYFGNPSRKMINAYTRALMGHIDLLTSRFRTEVYGRELDGIAREPLWYNGLDYKHGTGHGIGHFLNAQEGPAIIAPGYREYEQPITEGMFFTDEPGYYEDEEFGLRIGNVIYTKRAPTEYSFSTYTYLEFEVVSLIPFEPKLIDFSLLTRRQIEFYNNYMDRIRKEIGANPKLDRRGKEWMEWKTTKVWTKYEYDYNSASVVYPRLTVAATVVSVLVCKWLGRE
ncbi:Xaa-Pro aminopeptidase 2 [Holothuria leucospilota]|uniref:Xaa-Pro aminopeptidase 2 n=1 Tax=Holothuria leucospilota TaxID=206669 RepID=A0A9Q1BHK6_HOLLE|nr:Xaa-Pro aminopeptidase 2 [Holothuria leucospilota]